MHCFTMARSKGGEEVTPPTSLFKLQCSGQFTVLNQMELVWTSCPVGEECEATWSVLLWCTVFSCTNMNLSAAEVANLYSCFGLPVQQRRKEGVSWHSFQNHLLNQG